MGTSFSYWIINRNIYFFVWHFIFEEPCLRFKTSSSLLKISVILDRKLIFQCSTCILNLIFFDYSNLVMTKNILVRRLTNSFVTRVFWVVPSIGSSGPMLRLFDDF